MASRDTIRSAYYRVRDCAESLLIASARDVEASRAVHLELGIQNLKQAASDLGFDLVLRLSAEEAAELAEPEAVAA